MKTLNCSYTARQYMYAIVSSIRTLMGDSNTAYNEQPKGEMEENEDGGEDPLGGANIAADFHPVILLVLLPSQLNLTRVGQTRL